MFNVPEVCRRAAETSTIMSELKSKVQHKRPSTSPRSPLQQLLWRAWRLKSKNVDDDDGYSGEQTEASDYAPPEFAAVDGEHDMPAAPSPEQFTPASLSAAGLIGEEEHAPTHVQAALHLGLLEVFWKYKDQFLRPGDEMKAFFSAAMDGKEVVWGDAEGLVLWKAVIEIAVGRFEAWWKVVGRETEAAKWAERGGESESEIWEPRHGPPKKVTELPPEMLPPLDVLIVWHSFLLNPRCYYDDCFALGMPGMLAVAFPWQAIVGFSHLLVNFGGADGKTEPIGRSPDA